jgi:hypothetical protein
MYVALRPLKVSDGGSGLKTIPVGQSVPGVDQWQESVRRSHLQLGFLRYVPEEAQAPLVPQAKSAVQVSVQTNTKGNHKNKKRR